MMGLHPVEWGVPKSEELTFGLGDVRPLPTDLTVGNMHALHGSAREQVATDSRVDMTPVTDTFRCYLQGHLGTNALRPPLPAVAVSGDHYHVGGEPRVDMMLERNVSVSSSLGFVGSGTHCVPAESILERVPGGHIPCLAAGTAGLSRADSWNIEKNVSHALLPGTARPEVTRGDLPHLKGVKVKIEKMEPVEAKPFSLLARNLSLPTDLTPSGVEDVESSPVSLPTDLLPRECEEVKPHPELVAMPVTIELSDTESEGSAPCLSDERNKYESDGFMGSDQKCWVQQSWVPDSTGAPVADPKRNQHVPGKSLKPKMEGVTRLDSITAPSRPLKRKRSVIDLDSIIDLEEEQPVSEDTFNPSWSKEPPAARRVLADGSLVKNSQSEEKPVGFPKLLMGKIVNSSVPELPDRKPDLPLEPHGPITDLQVISDHHMEDPAKESDQQYVFDIGHDMDDATMEELMCDDEEDLEPDFMLGDNVDVDQNFVVASFETNCDGLIPYSKEDQEELPSWYLLAQARRSEETVWRSTSVDGQRFSIAGCSNGFELGSGNAIQVLKDPSSPRELNPQVASSRCSLTELANKEGAKSPQLGQLQIVKAASSVSDLSVLLPNGTAEAAEALRRFVQASSARGVFQPNSASMTPQVAHSEGATSQHEGACVPQNSSMGTVIPSLGEGNGIAENGALKVRPHGKSVLPPKSEPVELDAHGTSSTGPGFPVKTEWPRSNAIASFLGSRESIINALKLFELGRMQMLQAQVSTDPNVKRVRADLKVACSMRKNGMWQNEHRPIGECPGVKVGDCFTYRIEMAIIGLHRAVQAGIAVVSANHCPHGKPVAGSVVIGVNDTYKDDKDMGETVIYSGQGGLALDKSGIYQDQKLLRGNLALSNSLDLGLPVRLIRGHKIHGTNTGILYSYDGLYKVTDMDYSMGVHKNMVYTFRLERLPGQSPICPPNTASLLYPASVAQYPLPLNSQASLPTSTHVPHNQEQARIAQATSSQVHTNRLPTPHVPNFGGESWTGQVPISQTQSEPATSSQAQTNRLPTPHVPNFGGESWTGQIPISQTQSEQQGWTEEYEEKPTLFLLPRSSDQ